MLTNIVAIGVIDEEIRSNVRMLAVERPHRDPNGDFVIDKMPICYWSRATNNYFMTMRRGTLILVKGRLEHMPEVGLTIVADYMETLMPAKPTE